MYEATEDALRALIDALGGAKKVGAALYPAKRPDDAGRLLLHWCDPGRPEKPSLDELCWLLRRGHDANEHVLAKALMMGAGYKEPEPVNAVMEMAEVAAKMERLLSEERALLKQYESLALLTRGGRL